MAEMDQTSSTKTGWLGVQLVARPKIPASNPDTLAEKELQNFNDILP
jgi:hypothetical protein